MAIRLLKWGSVFTLGLITGATGISLVIGRNLDQAYLEIQNLNTLVADQIARIESLETELGSRHVILVKEIKVYVLEDDKYLRPEIEKITKELLEELIGKEVESLDPILVSNILNNRVVKIDNASYLLQVKGLLISEKIMVYLKPVKEDP